MVRPQDSGSEIDSSRNLYLRLFGASLTLLGILIGVLGILFNEIRDIGGDASKLREIAPFLNYLCILIVYNCALCVLALLSGAGYLRSKILVIGAACLMLVGVMGFVAWRSVQIP